MYTLTTDARLSSRRRAGTFDRMALNKNRRRPDQSLRQLLLGPLAQRSRISDSFIRPLSDIVPEPRNQSSTSDSGTLSRSASSLLPSSFAASWSKRNRWVVDIGTLRL